MERYARIFSLLLSLLVVAGLVACKDDANATGEGQLAMRMNIAMPHNGDAEQDTPDVLADSCRVRVYSNKGLVRYYKGLNNVPSELWLAAGDYKVAAVTGDSVPATFGMGYYKGESNLTIEAGKTATVNLVCKVVNTLVTVEFTPALAEILTDYQVTVSSKEASLVYTAAHTDSIGYFILPANENTLNWTITGTKTNGDSYSQQGIVPNVKPAMKYALTFDFNESQYVEGGAYFNLKINESIIEKVDHIVIYKRPEIIGNEFDITAPIINETNSGSETSVWINATSALSQLVVSGDNLQALGLPGNSIDFVSATESSINQWHNAGLSYRYDYDSSNDVSTAKLTFSEAFVKSLPEGVHEIKIKAADMHAKEWSETLCFTITNAVVLTEVPLRHEIWAKRATLRASLLRETTDELMFQYRLKGASDWTDVSANRNENILTAEVSGLLGGKTYEYRAVAGTMPSAVVVEFTTETEFVLPNGGFENWHKDGKVWLVCGSNENVWWDTGNHGSATLNVNITTQDTSIKNSGNSSIKMQSQYVSLMGIGKFAAGNVFAGVYAGTDGTNGILDLGRPCTSRPSKMKGYIKYVTGTVDYSSTDLLPKGATDIGNIYVAVGDWDVPVHVTTKDQTVFSRDDEKIIGFGEIVLTENTAGDGLIPFTIDLDYRSTTRIPTYIVIVASASYYGDYFTGSSSSTMWLDDLELIYE